MILLPPNPAKAGIQRDDVRLKADFPPLIPAEAGIQRNYVGRRPAILTVGQIPMFHVYIMASGRNGTLYIGMTDDLNRRIWEHQIGLRRGFTKTYDVKMLVWSEPHESRETAFARERAMKKRNRAWKLKLIEDGNPQWRDLALDLEP